MSPSSAPGSVQRLLTPHTQIEQGASYRCDDCMPYEADKTIWVCRKPRVPLPELWPRLKRCE